MSEKYNIPANLKKDNFWFVSPCFTIFKLFNYERRTNVLVVNAIDDGVGLFLGTVTHNNGKTYVVLVVCFVCSEIFYNNFHFLKTIK